MATGPYARALPCLPRGSRVLGVLAVLACVVATLLVPAPVQAAPGLPAPTAAPGRPAAPTISTTCASGATICRLTRYPGRPWVVLMGDSHALQYVVPVWSLAIERRVNLVVSFAGSCPLSVPFPASAGEPRMACDQHNAQALRVVRRLARSGRTVRLVLGSWWHRYRKELRTGVYTDPQGVVGPLTPYVRHNARLAVRRSQTFFRAVGRAGIAADVLAQSGSVPARRPACSAGERPYLCDLPRTMVLTREGDNRRFLARLSRHLANRPVVIDTSPAYCDATTCFGRVGGVATFADDAHLSQQLTPRTERFFRPTFARLEAQHRRR